MHGNVWEWCQDWINVYPGGIAVDPQGPAIPLPTWGSGRVFRGGSWGHWENWSNPRECRSACRGYYHFTGDRHYDIGFRAVLAPGQ